MEFSQDQVNEILDRIELQLGNMRKRKYQFYKECGISSAAYSFWNTGKSKPAPATLRKIADYLGVSYDWLVYGIQNIKPTESNDSMGIREEALSPEMRILFEAAEDAPASAILEAAAVLLRYKEQSENNS